MPSGSTTWYGGALSLTPATYTPFTRDPDVDDSRGGNRPPRGAGGGTSVPSRSVTGRPGPYNGPGPADGTAAPCVSAASASSDSSAARLRPAAGSALTPVSAGAPTTRTPGGAKRATARSSLSRSSDQSSSTRRTATTSGARRSRRPTAGWGRPVPRAGVRKRTTSAIVSQCTRRPAFSPSPPSTQIPGASTTNGDVRRAPRRTDVAIPVTRNGRMSHRCHHGSCGAASQTTENSRNGSPRSRIPGGRGRPP
jgi:hypothetical protein